MAEQFHMKGFILRLLDKKDEGMWDYEIADETLSEYGYQGAYWKGEVRLALTDLYSVGLVEDLEDKIAQLRKKDAVHQILINLVSVHPRI